MALQRTTMTSNIDLIACARYALCRSFFIYKHVYDIELLRRIKPLVNARGN